MPTQPKFEGLNIVLRGPFSPTVFQPKWLKSIGLLRESEAEEAKVEVIHGNLTSFSTSWLAFQATEDYLNISTTQASMYEPLRDLGLSILRYFPASPMLALGINADFHYMVENRAAYDRVGNVLVPKERWEALYPRPGMVSLTVRYPRPDDLKGHINVKVEPILQMGDDSNMVLVNINDHYDLRMIAEAKNVDSNRAAQDVLQEQLQASLGRARQFSKMIVNIAEEG
jgi:hypothetical protein